MGKVENKIPDKCNECFDERKSEKDTVAYCDKKEDKKQKKSAQYLHVPPCGQERLISLYGESFLFEILCFYIKKVDCKESTFFLEIFSHLQLMLQISLVMFFNCNNQDLFATFQTLFLFTTIIRFMELRIKTRKYSFVRKSFFAQNLWFRGWTLLRRGTGKAVLVANQISQGCLVA